MATIHPRLSMGIASVLIRTDITPLPGRREVTDKLGEQLRTMRQPVMVAIQSYFAFLSRIRGRTLLSRAGVTEEKVAQADEAAMEETAETASEAEMELPVGVRSGMEERAVTPDKEAMAGRAESVEMEKGAATVELSISLMKMYIMGCFLLTSTKA
jgi:hypothetical protein